jgi:hypothetical protein
LEGVEPAALVDVCQTALQHGPPVGQVVLRQRQLLAGIEDLLAQPAHLAFQLVHQAVGDLALPFDVAQLGSGVAHLAFQLLLLPAEPVPLRPDVLEPLAALLVILCGGLGGQRPAAGRDCRAPGHQNSGQQRAPEPRHAASVFPR